MGRAFGVEFASHIAIARFSGGAWSDATIETTGTLPLHPATHALHYSSSCFEGLKAYRRADGGVHIFRLDRHCERLRNSARLLCLPVPEAELLAQMIVAVVERVRDEVPPLPGSLYLRPVLFATDHNIGAAAKPAQDACLFVLASPVGEYFSGNRLRLAIAEVARTAPGFGEAKTGGNYAGALRHVVAARREHGVDQVLFCPDGNVQETAAANFLLFDDRTIVTKPLDGSILPGVTRDSLLTLAQADGLTVEERNFSVDEMLARFPAAAAALSGTAAVLSGVGSIIHRGREHDVGSVAAIDHLKGRLTAIHAGTAPDPFSWLTEV